LTVSLRVGRERSIPPRLHGWGHCFQGLTVARSSIRSALVASGSSSVVITGPFERYWTAAQSRSIRVMGASLTNGAPECPGTTPEHDAAVKVHVQNTANSVAEQAATSPEALYPGVRRSLTAALTWLAGAGIIMYLDVSESGLEHPTRHLRQEP
jgi:hypothetical protein